MMTYFVEDGTVEKVFRPGFSILPSFHPFLYEVPAFPGAELSVAGEEHYFFRSVELDGQRQAGVVDMAVEAKGQSAGAVQPVIVYLAPCALRIEVGIHHRIAAFAHGGRSCL